MHIQVVFNSKQMDKKILNEELNMMKYLLQYERGVVISEQKSKINEAGIYEPDNLGVEDFVGKLTQETGASQEEAEFAVCTAPSEVQSKFNNSKLGELFKKIEGLDLSSLKNLFKEIKGKMSQKNEQAGAVAGTMILGVPVSYVLLGLVALGVLTSIISRMGGGRRGYSSGGGCKAKRRQQKRGLGIFGDIRI